MEPRLLSYNIDQLFDGSVDQSFGSAEFGDTPSFANTYTDGVGSAIDAGQMIGNTILRDGYLKSSNYSAATAGWYLGPTTAEINVPVTVASLNIPDTTTASSFHVDTSGNAWWGTNVATGYATAPASILATGAATFSSITITGGSVASSTLSGTVPLSVTNIAAQGWTFSGTWSVTDADTIAWGAGTFTTAAGTAYSIGAGNTGNMVAKTYIYLDIGVSTTAFQTTTTVGSTVGSGKVLVAVAQNGTGEANYLVLNDKAYNIDAANIVAGSITANEIAASTITGTNIASLNISSKTATIDTGTIGGWTLGANRLSTGSGATTVAFDNTSTGADDIRIWAGSSTASSAPFRVTESGAVTATSATITGSITSTSGTIGGFSLASTTLSATNLTLTSGAANTANISVGTGSTLAGMNSGASGSDIAFWSGATYANRATAPFRVDLNGNVTATSATLSGYVVNSQGTFGGDGSDGALAITSGTTTLSFASASFLVKNYTSISITSTAKLATSTPATTGSALLLKSQGAVTITSSTTPCIDVSAMGGAGATSATTSGSNTAGTAGTNGGVVVFTSNAGSGGQTGTFGAGGSGTISSVLYPTSFSQHMNRYPLALCGSGGGSGAALATGAGSGTSGAGGRGGGCLLIECAGAWNFTTTNGISVAGGNGGNGSDTTSNTDSAGGGGGSGGFCLVLYRTLTANTGTVNVSGGTGGNNSSNVVINTHGGGGGGLLSAGTAGTTSNTANAKTGGDGASGTSTIAQNATFA